MAKDVSGEPREKTRLCPACRTPISFLATRCRHCGQKVDRPRDDGRKLTITSLGGDPDNRQAPLGITDLSAAARAGELAAPHARDEELAALLKMAPKRGRKNVLVVGHRGVGKAQLMHGAALALAKEDEARQRQSQKVPAALAKKPSPEHSLLEVNVAILQIGTLNVIDTAMSLIDLSKKETGLLLFVNGIRPLLAADPTEPSAESVLGTAIKDNEVPCIGTLTVQEYDEVFEAEPLLAGNFEVLRIEPMSEKDTLEILKARRPSLEKRYDAHISDRALKSAVGLTQRYMPDRYLPGKAVEVLDRACELYKLKVIAQSNYPAEWLDEASMRLGNEVGADHVRRAIAEITAIDIDAAEEELWARRLEERLKRFVVGQDAAIAQIAAAMSHIRTQLDEQGHPAGTLLFAGPCGVGKFHMVKALTYNLLGSYDHLTVFDMARYADVNAVTNLFGSTPWKSGNVEAGVLAPAVRSAPFAVVVFYSIEEAHPSFFDALLPILATGSLSDGSGNRADFSKCLFVLTSNCPPPESYDSHSPESLRAVLLRQVPREVVDRFDALVPFRLLDFADACSVVRLAIRDFCQRLKAQQIGINAQNAACEFIAKQGFSPENGVATLQQAVECLILGPISEMMAAKQIQSGDTAEVTVQDGQIVVRVAEDSKQEEP